MPAASSSSISANSACGSTTTPLPITQVMPSCRMPDGQQPQDELAPVRVDRVAGVVSALIARHDREVRREQVDDFAFALVAPLGAQHRDIHTPGILSGLMAARRDCVPPTHPDADVRARGCLTGVPCTRSAIPHAALALPVRCRVSPDESRAHDRTGWSRDTAIARASRGSATEADVKNKFSRFRFDITRVRFLDCYPSSRSGARAAAVFKLKSSANRLSIHEPSPRTSLSARHLQPHALARARAARRGAALVIMLTRRGRNRPTRSHLANLMRVSGESNR